jgi:peroxiredoxin
VVWHRFDEAAQRGLAPGFDLPSGSGHPVSFASFRNRSNLVFVFLPPKGSGFTRRFIQEMFDHREAYQDRDSKVVVFLQEGVSGLKALHDQHGPSIYLLADEDGWTRSRYASLLSENGSEEGLLIFVLDRYGAPFAAYDGDPGYTPIPHEEVLDWVDFIELQCPE